MCIRDRVGTSSFNVTPDQTGSYFNKLACFCFTEQTLAPGQEVSMPVLFYIDPALADDANARDATTITLSYTFHRAEGGTAQQGSAPRIAVAPTAANRTAPHPLGVSAADQE